MVRSCRKRSGLVTTTRRRRARRAAARSAKRASPNQFLRRRTCEFDLVPPPAPHKKSKSFRSDFDLQGQRFETARPSQQRRRQRSTLLELATRARIDEHCHVPQKHPEVLRHHFLPLVCVCVARKHARPVRNYVRRSCVGDCAVFLDALAHSREISQRGIAGLRRVKLLKKSSRTTTPTSPRRLGRGLDQHLGDVRVSKIGKIGKIGKIQN